MKYKEKDLLPEERRYLQKVLNKVSEITTIHIDLIKSKTRGLEGAAFKCSALAS